MFGKKINGRAGLTINGALSAFAEPLHVRRSHIAGCEALLLDVGKRRWTAKGSPTMAYWHRSRSPDRQMPVRGCRALRGHVQWSYRTGNLNQSPGACR